MIAYDTGTVKRPLYIRMNRVVGAIVENYISPILIKVFVYHTTKYWPIIVQQL